MKFIMDHNLCVNTAYDFNIVKRSLLLEGHEEVDDFERADILIYGSCGVRGVWVDEAIDKIKIYCDRNKGVSVIVTSCGIRIDGDRFKSQLADYPALYLSHGDLVEKYTDMSFRHVEKGLGCVYSSDLPKRTSARDCYNENKLIVLNELAEVDKKYGSRLLEKYNKTTKGVLFYKDDKIGLLMISRGCPYQCSFCSIPKGRGEYGCVPVAEILSKVSQYDADGCDKLYLLGEDVGSYKCPETGLNIVGLLSAIKAKKNNIMLGLRYLEPVSFTRFFNDFLEVFKGNYIFLAYIPLQSGSSRILKKMYRYSDINSVANKLMQVVEETDVAVYTNWMIGFPGEEKDDFSKTLNLCLMLNFDVNVVIPYSERPNTDAILYEEKVRLSTKITRTNIMRKIVAEMKAKKLFVGFESVPEKEKLRLCKLIVDDEMRSVDNLYD